MLVNKLLTTTLIDFGGYTMKRIIIIVSCFILVFCAVGCEKDTVPETSSTTGQVNAVQFASPTYNDWQEFLSAWTQGAQAIQSNMASVNGANNSLSLTIPILKSSAYEFYQVEISDDQYEYYYVPVNYEKSYFSTNEGIIITLEKDAHTFTAVMAQLNLTPVNGIAYDESRNTWFLNKDGKCLDVAFPESLPVTTEDELYSYFDFEEYTASGNAGKVQ